METGDRRGTSRRGFVGGALAAGAALGLMPLSLAQASGERPYEQRRRIDLHAHHLPPFYVDALHDAGIFLIGGIPIPDWSPDLARDFMGRYGIATQVLSLSDPGVDFLPAGPAADLAGECNDYLAQLLADDPGSFGALAALSLQSPDAAAAEAERALDELGLDGVGLLSSNAGRYLGDPAFTPLLEALDARGAWVMVHPTAVAATDMPSYSIPSFVAEYPFDTTRTFISLLFNGRLQQFRNIRWHFAHGGGTLPMLRFRLGALADAAKEFGPLLGLPSGSSGLVAETPERVIRKAFFDTALIADRPALEALAAMARPNSGSDLDNVLFGSDWPFASRLYPGSGDPQPALSKVFPSSVRKAIDRRNAKRQIPRLGG